MSTVRVRRQSLFWRGYTLSHPRGVKAWRALVAEVERWAAAQGCSELASDSPIENIMAHATHRALGFEETERVVYFRRAVHGA